MKCSADCSGAYVRMYDGQNLGRQNGREMMPRGSWGAFKVKGILMGLKDKRAACGIGSLSPDIGVTRQRYARD